MSILSGLSSNFFGLDIGTTAIRLVQLSGAGANKNLVKYAYVPIDSKIALSDSRADQQKMLQIISDLLAQAQITTKDVAVGVPSTRVFTTVIDFDKLSPSETARAIKYQADSFIPTPVEQSKIDWAVIGDSPKDRTKVEVLLSSVDNEYIEKRLDMLESIGLNVIAFEPDNLALVRALTVGDVSTPQMILDIGNKNTDLVITMNNAPRLTRSIPTGTEAIIRTAAQNLNVDDKQAEQFVFKFGMSKDKLEGRVFDAISGSIDLLASDIEKSIQFFQTRYGTNVSRIIVTGGASSMPEFPVYLANKFGVEVEIGNSWRNVSYAPNRQNELLSVSNHFGVAAGLAERIG
jgi:type IV pilus assembly protein PilM